MDSLPPHAGGFAVWDIIRVDFPHADADAHRRRPALVIAAPEVDPRFAILWTLMITSARHTSWPLDVLISDVAGSGLSHPSLIRTTKIAALSARRKLPRYPHDENCRAIRTTKIAAIDARFAAKIGGLPAAYRDHVKANLNQILGESLGL